MNETVFQALRFAAERQEKTSEVVYVFFVEGVWWVETLRPRDRPCFKIDEYGDLYVLMPGEPG